MLAIERRLALGCPLSILGEHGRRLALLREAEVLGRALDDRALLVRGYAPIEIDLAQTHVVIEGIAVGIIRNLR